jgi:hypothetical protein
VGGDDELHCMKTPKLRSANTIESIADPTPGGFMHGRARSVQRGWRTFTRLRSLHRNARRDVRRRRRGGGGGAPVDLPVGHDAAVGDLMDPEPR